MVLIDCRKTKSKKIFRVNHNRRKRPIRLLSNCMQKAISELPQALFYKASLNARPFIIPKRTFLVRFGGTSGEFGRAMVRILARRSRAKIPMARPNEPYMMPSRRTKKVRLGIYRTQIFSPKFSVTVIKSARRVCQVRGANCVDLLELILFWSLTLLSSSSSDIFLTRLFGVSFPNFPKSKFSE